ncbi:2-hydroxyacid dehydrogenase [Aurantiacibacter spongiae]|uniref:D-glycerate dehydrogenase n=1 Tax=Aurantiacibacter spongiae TaxID=2488860 RepID=A0A3N5DGW3_9SPHN|nr:D-glycerate dehydrogenase [Aurantiacibacter spongiae]RPF70912.1 D-glycerate dehydrogenase [Aurantiacibacter spongiae]
MTDLRVFVTRKWPDEVEAALTSRFDTVLNDDEGSLDRSLIAHAMARYDVLCPTVGDTIDADLINEADRCRLIANYGVGFDHIDLDAAKAKGIAVTNTPGVLTDATADLAMTLLLMAARRTGEGERMVRSGEWSGWHPRHLVGSAVSGKTLGVVGFGRIGQALAKRAQCGFGMTILYHARHEVGGDIVRDTRARFCPDLAGLLEQSDFVSIHVPGGEGTRHLIDSDALAAMKPGSFLINTARGSVVDHDALAAGLRSGHPAGAGLDVFPEEPLVPPALLDLDNVVLLPHLGSADAETRRAMGMRALRNIEAFARGADLPDRVA